MSRNTTVTGKRPHKSRLPGVAGDETTHTSDDKQGLQNNSTGLVVQGLVVELQDGDLGGRVDEFAQVLETEEHGDAVEPRGGEANTHSGQDGDGDVALRLGHFLGHVRGGVETGEDPVRVDETNNEGHAVGLPSGRVDKLRKDVVTTLVAASTGRDGNQDDEERDQRDVQRPLGHQRQCLAPAVEQVAEEVDQLVDHDAMPCFDDTVTVSLKTDGQKEGCKPTSQDDPVSTFL